MKILQVIIFLSLVNPYVAAQMIDPGHDLHHDDHQHKTNEFGAGNYLTYITGEKEFAYGLHLHYLRSFRESRFGIGVGYERLFDDHNHQTVGIIGTFRPLHGVVISLSPGLLLKSEANSSIKPVLHAEAMYEVELGSLHVGPAVDFSKAAGDAHFSVGVHIAYGF